MRAGDPVTRVFRAAGPGSAPGSAEPPTSSRPATDAGRELVGVVLKRGQRTVVVRCSFRAAQLEFSTETYTLAMLPPQLTQ